MRNATPSFSQLRTLVRKEALMWIIALLAVAAALVARSLWRLWSLLPRRNTDFDVV